MCFTAKPAVVCELSTKYEAAISISEASCMGCSSLCRWDAVAECRFLQHVQNTFPDQERVSIAHEVKQPLTEMEQRGSAGSVHLLTLPLEERGVSPPSAKGHHEAMASEKGD